MKKVLYVLLLISIFSSAYSQNMNKYLREYIESGLKNNLELQSAKEMLNVYDSKLSQSISSFMPKVDISARYTRAGGGRSFVFPLGDMMNPLYKAVLNMDNAFQNEEVSFMREKEHDTKVEVIQPIFNLAILYNYKAQDNLYESALHEYKAKEISFIYSLKDAYYNYAKVLQLVQVRKSAVKLAQENYDVIDKMYKVDKVPKSDLLRAEVLLAENQQELKNATNQSQLAKNLFNNLLNRDYESEINIDSIPVENLEKSLTTKDMSPGITLDQAMELALSSRPELRQMEYAIKSAENAKNIMKSDYFPNISLVADYGYQGEKYEFKKPNDYWTVSGVLSWNLFSGFGTNAKVNEMEAQANSLQKNYENVRQLTRLDVKNNFIDLQNYIELMQVAGKRIASAEENFKMIRKRYEEGLAALINLIDAQTSLDGARANYVVTFYSALSAKAKLEKSLGAFYIGK
jgi:outer membrane protein